MHPIQPCYALRVASRGRSWFILTRARGAWRTSVVCVDMVGVCVCGTRRLIVSKARGRTTPLREFLFSRPLFSRLRVRGCAPLLPTLTRVTDRIEWATLPSSRRHPRAPSPVNLPCWQMPIASSPIGVRPRDGG